MRSRASAENRTIAASENSSNKGGMHVRGSMAHAVDALVQAYEQPLTQPSFDRADRNAGGQKLRARNDAVLTTRDPGDDCVRFVDLTTHTVV